MDQLSTTLADAETASSSRIEVQSGSLELAGRITIHAPDVKNAVATLLAGDTFLGTLRLSEDKAHSREGTTELKFSAADFGLAAFARICGVGELSIAIESAGGGSQRHPITNEGALSSSFAPLGMRLSAGAANLRLADLWLESSRTLALRFEAATKVSKTVDVYQGRADLPLVLVAAAQPILGLTSVVEIPLINPFAPLLVVLKGEDDCIDAVDLIPFPSLARGGLHHPELLIASNGGDEMAGAASLSRDLLAGWLERLDQPERCVSTIEIDPAVHTGLEPILNQDLLQWLRKVLQVDVRLHAGGDRSAVPDFIRDMVGASVSRGEPAGNTLQLPASSVPTIASLVAVLPADATAGTFTGGTAVADWNRGGSVWSIWHPPFNETLERLQPANARRFAPALTIRSRGNASEPGNDIVFRYPLAIALREPSTRIGSASPFEISPEAGDLLPRTKDLGKHSVDVIIFAGSSAEQNLALLESLARQEAIEVKQLALCSVEGQPSPALEDALRNLFPDRAAVLEVARNRGRLEQLVAAREQLSSDKILLLGGSTVLTDARAVSTLCRMLDVPEVASVGCLLRAANQKMSPVSAGYSFSGINLYGTPTVAFDVIDPSVWLAPATYPVVANPLSMLVTRREVIEGIRADGSTAIRSESDDLLFGIQAIEQGGVNLCTTIVSAFVPQPVTRGSLMSLSIPYRLSPDVLQKIGESSTIVQRAA